MAYKMAGKWHKEPFLRRTYEKLTDYAVTNFISEAEGELLRQQLVTPLDGFQGQAYNYDDHGLTEEWMVTFKDKGSSGPSEDDVIRTQLVSLLDIMKSTVQDRVCTENGVLNGSPIGLGDSLKEVPVWGIDCFTRRNIEMAVEDRVPSARHTAASVKRFIERRVLPTINQQAPEVAHNMSLTASSIIEVSSVY